MKEKLPDKPREITLVFGKTGMGKSNWNKVYLGSLRRVIILDPLGEYPGIEFDDLEDMLDYIEGNQERFVVKSSNVLDLEGLSEIALGIGNCHFIIEEAQRCLPASNYPLPESFKSLIFQGRHFGNSIVVSAQRPSIVNIAARSQWTRIISFNLTETADVGWLEQTSGYTIRGETDIRKFPVGEHLEITPGTIERKKAPLYVPRRKEEKKELDIDKILTTVAVAVPFLPS